MDNSNKKTVFQHIEVFATNNTRSCHLRVLTHMPSTSVCICVCITDLDIILNIALVHGVTFTLKSSSELPREIEYPRACKASEMRTALCKLHST